MAEKNDLEIKFEKTLQYSGKKDFKDEIHVMAALLSKEMEMMENQLNRSKDLASEALALHEEADSLRILLAKKVVNHPIHLALCFLRWSSISTVLSVLEFS